MSRRWGDVACCAAFGVLLWACAVRLERVERTDPDRYYHYSISRAAAGGLVREVPQIVGLGWNVRFDEKEWLFHQLGGVAWWLAGERGVDAFCFLLGWLDLVLVYLLCRRAQGPLVSFALVASTCLASSQFLFRLLLVRPHLLGLACGLSLVHGLLARRTWAVALAATVFALSYHALFVPLALAGLFALRAPRRGEGWRLLLVTAAGLALGSLVSPAFPGNLWSTWAGWRIAWTTAGDPNAGAENLPLPWPDLLRSLGPCFAGYLVAASRWRADEPARVRRYFVLAAGVFWVLTVRMPRAAEYAVPLTAAALAFAALELEPWLRAVTAGLMVVASVPGQLRLTRVLPVHTYNEGIARSVEALPAEGAFTVLNCSFADGAYLLYLRPNLRFVDVLDPLLLKTKRPELAAAREAMWRGEADPWEVATRLFPADFVICGYLPARARLEGDPRFRRLHPPAGQPVPRSSGPPVYQVLRDGG